MWGQIDDSNVPKILFCIEMVIFILGCFLGFITI